MSKQTKRLLLSVSNAITTYRIWWGKYFMNLFDLEEGEIEAKDIVVAGGSLILTMGFIFLPLYM